MSRPICDRAFFPSSRINPDVKATFVRDLPDTQSRRMLGQTELTRPNWGIAARPTRETETLVSGQAGIGFARPKRHPAIEQPKLRHPSPNCGQHCKLWSTSRKRPSGEIQRVNLHDSVMRYYSLVYKNRKYVRSQSEIRNPLFGLCTKSSSSLEIPNNSQNRSCHHEALSPS